MLYIFDSPKLYIYSNITTQHLRLLYINLCLRVTFPTYKITKLIYNFQMYR